MNFDLEEELVRISGIRKKLSFTDNDLISLTDARPRSYSNDLIVDHKTKIIKLNN